jgi:hypothetical protein
MKEKAGRANLKPSEYIRQIAINGLVKARETDEEMHSVRQLVGMANNLNQLTKLAHSEGLLSIMLIFEKYRKQFDEILKNLKNDK